MLRTIVSFASLNGRAHPKFLQVYIYNFNSFQSWNSLIGIKIDFVLMFFPRKSHLFRSGGKIEERRFDQGGD